MQLAMADSQKTIYQSMKSLSAILAKWLSVINQTLSTSFSFYQNNAIFYSYMVVIEFYLHVINELYPHHLILKKV